MYELIITANEENGHMHISVIGDSLTKGVILSEGKYQELEEGFVNIVSREKGLALKNFSKFGSTVRYGHSVLTRHSAEISESEYTIIEFGGNDSDFIWDVVASEPYTRHQSRTPEGEYYELYADLIHKVRDLGSEPIMLSLAPIIGKRYFSFVTRRMTDERKSNVYKWLGYDSEAMYRWHEHYNEATFQIARMTDTPIIDITSSLDRCVGGKEQYYCEDGIHPNAEGHRFIASQIMKNVE